MASNVRISTKSYECSQTVTIDCIQSLVEKKDKVVTLPFHCARDPKPVKFCMHVIFGPDEHFGVFLCNLSKRKVSVNFQIVVSNKKNPLANSVNKRCLEAQGTIVEEDELDSWGDPELLKLNDVVKVSPLIVKCVVEYDGEIQQEDTDLGDSTSEDDSHRNLSTDLINMWINEEDTDVSFEVGQEIFKAHRNILSARSDYFKSMFNSGMVESLKNNNPILIQECNPEMFKKILKFLYTDIPPKDLNQVAIDLLPLADKYLINALKKHCVMSLKKKLNQENVKEVLLLAHKHHCPSLKLYCFKKLTLSMFNGWNEIKEHGDLMVEYLQFLSNLLGQVTLQS